MIRLLLLLALVGCRTPQEAAVPDPPPAPDRFQRMEERLQRMEAEQDALARAALCPKEVRRLLEDGRRECKPGTACKNPEIGLFVSDADPTHQGRFITLMASQDRRAFYFKDLPAPAAPADTKRFQDPFTPSSAPRGLGDRELKRLRRLMQGTLLRSTQFLVVSHPGTGRDTLAAERRGALLIDRMVDIAARDHIDLKPARILHWIYPFALQRGERLRADEAPPPGFRYDQSVWVFRVDC